MIADICAEDTTLKYRTVDSLSITYQLLCHTSVPMSRSRAWCFTINNPEDVAAPQAWPYSYLVYQQEAGEQGTSHLQGYIYTEHPQRLVGMKKLDARAHWEVAKGTAEQNRVYCTKEAGRLAGPFEFGSLPRQGKRNDLNDLKESLDAGRPLSEIANTHFTQFLKYSRGIEKYQLLNTKPRDWETKVRVYWGETGVGKTRLCHDKYPTAYWKTKSNGSNNWWDGYINQEIVIIDEFYGWFTWDFILRLLDRYPLSVETKGGAVQFVAKKIIFTSNSHPKEWYPKMVERYGWGADPVRNPLERRLTKTIQIHPPLPSSPPPFPLFSLCNKGISQ